MSSAAFDPGCVKTHTSAKCRKYNSLKRHQSVCAQYDLTRRTGREQLQKIPETNSWNLVWDYPALRLARNSQTLYVAHTGKWLSLLARRRGDRVMETRHPELEVRVRKGGELYAWELHFIGHNQAVRFSVPIFVSEADAGNAGQKVLGTIIVKRERTRPVRSRAG